MRQTNIQILSNGLKLAATIFYPPYSNKQYPGLLVANGWGLTKESSYRYAKSLSNHGYICLVFDNSGFGQSEGDLSKLTNADFFNHLLDMFDFCAQ